jgi:hypothetical protein
MTDSFMPLMRALVAAALLLATATLMLVAVNTARAAGALAIGKCGAFGESYDFLTTEAAGKNALAKCAGNACRVVASVQRGCAALAINYISNPCGPHGWGKSAELGRAQNAALRACYKDGGKEWVIRTFFATARADARAATLSL